MLRGWYLAALWDLRSTLGRVVLALGVLESVVAVLGVGGAVGLPIALVSFVQFSCSSKVRDWVFESVVSAFSNLRSAHCGSFPFR